MKKSLSKTRVKRIREQGYSNYKDQEIRELAFGNRFAYRLCTLLLITGVATASVPLLSLMLIVAFLGFTLPYHPFDYIYNEWLADRLSKPKLPKRSDQLKFACTMASVFIATTIYLFTQGFTIAGYIVGAMLSIVAFLVASVDFCIPSIIYNYLIVGKRKSKTSTPKHS